MREAAMRLVDVVEAKRLLQEAAKEWRNMAAQAD
jgi:hypothetical protein